MHSKTQHTYCIDVVCVHMYFFIFIFIYCLPHLCLVQLALPPLVEPLVLVAAVAKRLHRAYVKVVFTHADAGGADFGGRALENLLVHLHTDN